MEKVCRSRLLSPFTLTVLSLSFQDPRRSSSAEKSGWYQSGSGKPNKDKVGKISRAQLQEIAQTKAADMTGADIEAMTRSIEGTARSMGLVVED